MITGMCQKNFQTLRMLQGSIQRLADSGCGGRIGEYLLYLVIVDLVQAGEYRMLVVFFTPGPGSLCLIFGAVNCGCHHLPGL